MEQNDNLYAQVEKKMLDTATQISEQYKTLEKQIQEQGIEQKEFKEKWEKNEIFTETKSAIDKLTESFKTQQEHLNKLDVTMQDKLSPSQKAKSDLRSRIQTKMADERTRKDMANLANHSQAFSFKVASASFEETADGKIEVKAPTTTADITGGTNYQTAQDQQGTVIQPYRARHLRDIVPVRPISQAIVSFLRKGAITNAALVVAEGVAKPELEAAFAEIEHKAQVIAGLMTVTKQMLDDMPLASSIIPEILTQEVLLAEDTFILKDATQGVYTQATAFTAASGYWNAKVPLANILDVMIALRSVATSEEYMTNLMVINPNELGSLDVLKASDGSYIAENWPSKLRVPVLEMTVMAVNELLAGDFSASNMYVAEKDTISVEFFPQHSDNVAKNQITIRAEERLACIVRNPLAFRKADISTVATNMTPV